MAIALIVLGITVLVLTLTDTFLAVLNYDEPGIFVFRIVRWHWLLLRAFTRRVSRRWRPVALRQVTGIIILVTILWWVVGILLGFALIYLGAMHLGGIQVASGVPADIFGAFYVSLGQFSTVGVDNVTPEPPFMNLLAVIEALTSIILLPFIILFLRNVSGVIQSLGAFSSSFFLAGRGIARPIDTLDPFFPDGEAKGLDHQLGSIRAALTAYSDGLAQNRAAYYFQSGRDQFSLPYALSMTSGVISALRWGLPANNEISKEPELVLLLDAYEDFRLRLTRMMRLPRPPLTSPVEHADFLRTVAAQRGATGEAGLDPWVLRFLGVEARMAELTHSSLPTDLDDAYDRYLRWLTFESESQAFLAVVSHDLDYQPVYRRNSVTPVGVPLDRARPTGAAQPSQHVRHTGTGGWMRRMHVLIDPGYQRLADALRAVAGAVLSIGLVVPASMLIGASPSSGAVFAGLVFLFAAPATAGAARRRGAVGLLVVVPAILGVLIGAVIPREPVFLVVGMAGVAALATLMERFGTRTGRFGRLGFVTFYFTLLLGIDPRTLIGAIIAVLIGVVCCWGVNLIPGPSPAKLVQDSVAALTERVGAYLGVLFDIVSTGRRDGPLLRTARAERRAIDRCVGAITAQVDGEAVRGLSNRRAENLRVRSFDVQLAATRLAEVLPMASNLVITVEGRERLANALIDVQQDVVAGAGTSAVGGRSRELDATGASWSSTARQLFEAIEDLGRSVDRLHHASAAGEDELPDLLPADRDASPTTPPAARARVDRGAVDRRALQAAISTGLALFLGSLVSTSHQYWAAMPAFQVLSGSNGETRSAAIQRILATIAGSAVAFGLTMLANHDARVAIPLLVVSVFMMAFVRAISKVWLSFWQTILLATMYDVLGTLNVESVQVRMLETAIGSIVAVVVSALILPTHTRVKVRAGIKALVESAGDLAGRLLGPGAHELSAAAIRAGERELAGRLTEVEALARPIRHDPGAQHVGGIEPQLAAVRALVSHEENLVRLMLESGRPSMDTDDWRRLGEVTRANFESARAVLDETAPETSHQAVDLESLDPLRADARAVITEIARVNETLGALETAIGGPSAHSADEASVVSVSHR